MTTMTIADFTDKIGITPLSRALRAIDKYNLEHVWLVLSDGTRLYYHTDHLDQYDPQTTTVEAVGAGCIAWDGSDWEAAFEQPLKDGNSIDAVRAACLESYEAYEAFKSEE